MVKGRRFGVGPNSLWEDVEKTFVGVKSELGLSTLVRSCSREFSGKSRSESLGVKSELGLSTLWWKRERLWSQVGVGPKTLVGSCSQNSNYS